MSSTGSRAQRPSRIVNGTPPELFAIEVKRLHFNTRSRDLTRTSNMARRRRAGIRLILIPTLPFRYVRARAI